MNLKPNPFLSTMMPQNLKKLTLILICLFISFLSFSQSNPDTVDDEGNEPKLKFWQNLKDAPLSFGLPLKNANTPLNIPTPDSTSEAVHPSIIDFYNEYGMTTWNGYRYWMAYTPYFLTNAIVENPVIAASNDGVTWVIPKGLKFPLIPAPEIGNNCDVDMVFNSDSDQLWVYYMYRGPVVIGNDTMISGLKLIKVNADMSSTDPMLVKPFKETDEATIVSPCIWRESATRWHMWGVYILSPNPIVYSFSNDGIHWQPDTICKDELGNNSLKLVGYYAWHLGCKPNYFEKRIEFMVASRQRLEDHPYNPVAIVFAQCTMGKPTIITTPLNMPILINNHSPNPVPWDMKVYRPTFECYRTDNGYNYKIWYSAVDNKKHWHIGLVEGAIPSTFTPNPISFDSIPKESQSDTIVILTAKTTSDLKIKFKISNTTLAKIENDTCYLTGTIGQTKITASLVGDSIFKVDRWLIISEKSRPIIPNKEFIFPNPADDYIELKISNINYKLYNSQGILLMGGHLESNRINIKTLKPDIYFLRIGNQSFKIIKK